jgi:peptidyl-prolyl cis-trans isomerase SurA
MQTLQAKTIAILTGIVISIGTNASNQVPDTNPQGPAPLRTNQDQPREKPVLIDQVVAIVNKQVITSAELDNAVKEAEAQLSSTANINDQLELKKQVLQNLINKKIALQIAKNNNIVVSSLEVSNTIDNILNQNKITLEQLKMKLRYSGISYRAYRGNIRDQITISKLQQQAIANTIYISPQDIQKYIDKNFKQSSIDYKIQHILMPLPNDYTPKQETEAVSKAKQIVNEIKSDSISFDQAAEKYSQSADSSDGGNLGYMNANALPKVFVDPVKEMKIGEIYGPFVAGGSIQIIKLVDKKDAPIEQHYISQYNIQQIKIDITPIVDSEQAREQLDRILISLNNGKDFSQLAKSHSQNYDTASNGGDLGWKSLNEVSYQIGEKAQLMKIGEVSKPFRDGNSWEIIKLLGKRQKNDTDEYLKQQASNVLFQEKAQQAIKSWMISLRDSAFVEIVIPELEPSDT